MGPLRSPRQHRPHPCACRNDDSADRGGKWPGSGVRPTPVQEKTLPETVQQPDRRPAGNLHPSVRPIHTPGRHPLLSRPTGHSRALGRTSRSPSRPAGAEQALCPVGRDTAPTHFATGPVARHWYEKRLVGHPEPSFRGARSTGVGAGQGRRTTMGGEEDRSLGRRLPAGIGGLLKHEPPPDPQHSRHRRRCRDHRPDRHHPHARRPLTRTRRALGGLLGSGARN